MKITYTSKRAHRKLHSILNEMYSEGLHYKLDHTAFTNELIHRLTNETNSEKQLLILLNEF